MPVTIPVTNCAQVELLFTVAGKQGECVTWFECLSPPIDSAKLATLALRVSLVTGLTIKNALSSDLLYRGARATDFSAGPGITFTSTAFAGPGLGGPCRSASIALRLCNHTAPDRTAHKWYTFVPGVRNDMLVGNNIDSSWADGIAVSFDQLRINIPIFGWRRVVIATQLAGAPLSSALVFPVTGTTVDSYVVSPHRYRLLDRPS